MKRASTTGLLLLLMCGPSAAQTQTPSQNKSVPQTYTTAEFNAYQAATAEKARPVILVDDFVSKYPESYHLACIAPASTATTGGHVQTALPDARKTPPSAQGGIYGTIGVPSPNNIPGSRVDAVTWVDPSGIFWLFGGFGHDSTGANGPLNDLWKYNAGAWTWVSGSNLVNQSGVYGTQGVPVSGNIPGARNSSAGWTDLQGDLWLFGGAGQSGFLNDLWKYSNGQWTWMAGAASPAQPGACGTQGMPGADNVPGARQTALSWTDSSGNFWLFGGNGIDSTGSTGLLNDLWKYSNGEWTWMSGAKLINQNGMYGAQGSPAPGNVPGARFETVGRVDANGNLWLFRGYGAAGGTEDRLNDLWMYMP